MDLSKTNKILRKKWMAFLMLMAFMLTGAGKAFAQNAQFPTPPQSSYTFTSQVYEFTPAKDGTLSMSGAYLDSDGNIWYETWTGSTKDSRKLKQTTKGTYSNGYTWTWEMVGGKTYYFNGKGNQGTFTDITYTPEGGDVTPLPEPTITPDQTETIEAETKWPDEIFVKWGDLSLTLNQDYSTYDENMIKNLAVTLNGQTVTRDEWGYDANFYAEVCVWADMGGWGYWENAENGPVLVIRGLASLAAAQEGDKIQVSFPAGAVKIGDNGDLNEAFTVTYTSGDVEYDDSVVKTYGSKVYFTGPNTCEFITREDDMATLSIITDVEENLTGMISMTYKVDPNDPKFDKSYSYEAVRMDNGNVAYNFKSVTYNQMTFEYTGEIPVNFTFQKEPVDGDPIGGLEKMGEFELGVPFNIEKNQQYTYTFNEIYSEDLYIKKDIATNILNNGTLVVTNAADFSIIDGWKNGRGEFEQIAATDGTYGYNGHINISYVPYTIYVSYTGEEPVTLTIGEGEFTENGVAGYMEEATYTPVEITVEDTDATIAISWGEDVTMVHNDYGIAYTFNGEPQAAVLEVGNFMQFTNPTEGVKGVKNGESGQTLYLMLGAALSGEPQIGTYAFTLAPGTLKNADGDLNPKQVFTITVTEAPEEPSLYFEDFEMEFTKGSTDAVTATIPVSLEIDKAFQYKGFQFDITLPLNFKATDVALNEEIQLGQYGTAKVVAYSATDVPANTYRVIANFNTATNLTEDIATLTISGVYNDQMVNEQEYDVTIQNTVVFSTPGGSDITSVNGYTGNVTVLINVPAEKITFDKVELAEPSFTDQEGNVTEVTQGESVDMTIVVEPSDTTDELEVSADNGATVTQNEDGTWNVDTSGVEVEPGEEVKVTVTAKAGDVTETYELTVKGVLLGDSNANGKVTVADVVTTANYLAEKPIDNFCFPNANVMLTPNDKGEQAIEPNDLSATINIVLKIWNGQREINARRHANRYASNDRLVADNFNAGQNVIGINLDNTANYSVLQATIELPAGMKVENVSVGPRAASHELVYNVVDGKLNVVLFSYSNDSFTNGEGSLFNISVKADENCGDLVMTNILAADAAANGYELASEGGIYTGTTGINVIGAEEGNARYFTVDGIEVFNPEKGQILIRVENGEAVKVLVK